MRQEEYLRNTVRSPGVARASGSTTYTAPPGESAMVEDDHTDCWGIVWPPYLTRVSDDADLYWGRQPA